MHRRKFLSRISEAALGVRLGPGFAPLLTTLPKEPRASEVSSQVLIIGGGMGGCAAALALARNGIRVVMTEETDWIGGQLTQQAVPPDEHPWIESFGGTASYREFRTRVRQYYRRNYPLSAAAYQKADLNPGNGSVSRLCHEPRVALAALEEMLAPYVSGGRLTILRGYRPISATTSGDSVSSVTVQSSVSSSQAVLSGDFFLDATELGDLLPLSQTEYVTGFQSRRQTGEPHAPDLPQPNNVQAITWCFPMDYLSGENHVIDKPGDYGFWRDYVPKLQPSWPGRLLSWQYSHPVTLEPRALPFDPPGRGGDGRFGLWTYRRIADKTNFVEGTYLSDITLVNWPQNDYWLGNLIDVSEEEAKQHLERSRQLSLSLLYWMQTEAPRPDGGSGWPGLRLRPDIVGTSDGLAQRPYIRESRRIQAEFTVVEQHVATDARMQITGKTREEVTAEWFADSVGIGSYRIDLHPSTGGNNYIDISSLPFQIPLGALIHRRVENLLPACKNLGVTHITNGCYRLHPVEWNIGESAGLVAAFALQKKTTPRHIRNNKKLLQDFQRWIQVQGMEINWPKITPR